MATTTHHQILPLESTQSVWAASTERPRFSPLATDVETDVCIVGAGISGLTTAYLLTKAGKKVVVLDDGEISSGQSEVTTAHLSDEIDDGFTRMIRLHGEENTRLAADSHAASIDCIESIVKELKIDCEFKRIDGYLFAADEDDRDYVEDEYEAAMRAGRDVSMVERCPLDYDTGPAIRYRRQARFHPLKYLAAVAEAIRAKGGQIFTQTHADKIEGGEKANVKARKYTVRARHIVVATNTPVNDMFVIHTKQYPYMTYAIGVRVPKGSVTDAMYWDTFDAYHYVRLQPMNGDGADKYDLLIVGGEDHKTGQAKDTLERHARLEEWTRERFPMAEDVEFNWAGQCMETIDGLAFIGRNPGDKDNVYIATGDSGMGITHGTIAGMLLCDIILGKENPWEKIYDPSRKATRGTGSFLKENLNVAAQYLDWVTPGEVSSEADIEFGSGAIVRQGLKKIAVYRDEAGKCHKMSAVCPHLQCIVEWNAAESSWDCPCHGSRFDKLGKCINGPSNVDLPPAEA